MIIYEIDNFGSLSLCWPLLRFLGNNWPIWDKINCKLAEFKGHLQFSNKLCNSVYCGTSNEVNILIQFFEQKAQHHFITNKKQL